MKLRRWWWAALLVLALCAGCQGETRILPGENSLQVTLQDNAFRPRLWRINAGEQISITLDNRDVQAHRWVMMGRPVTPPYDSPDEQAVYWQMDVPAGQQVSATFSAPQAPGEYEVLCPEHSETMQARVVVVRP